MRYPGMTLTTCKEIGVKLDEVPWYEHLPKSIETGLEYKVTNIEN
jgi:hypothetical protein